MNEEEFIDIAVLEMGGTINGILDPEDTPPTESRVIAHLQRNANNFQIRITTEIVTMKDSRAVEAVDRQRLVEVVLRCSTDRILVPHGTFTMSETGEFLMDNLKSQDLKKSIILVGAMIPLGEPESDAQDNIRFALEQLREAPEGVWIAMNDTLWIPREVEKDSETGIFRARNGV